MDEIKTYSPLSFPVLPEVSQEGLRRKQTKKVFLFSFQFLSFFLSLFHFVPYYELSSIATTLNNLEHCANTKMRESYSLMNVKREP